jgi:GGDEF domain-containing protein
MMGKMSEFHLCDIKAFYDGLEVAVGMPNPDLFESMRREHTKRSDSDIWFTTSNYSCHTSSCIEWYFVVEPARGKEVLKRKSYPSEAAGLERRKRRNERELDTFDVAISDVNNRLRQHAQRPLRKEEFIASRLYTGPMFQKYNAVLRANAGDAKKTPKWMKDYFQQLCKGNRYTTTIWVLNSAIVKLKALTPAARVYRGFGLAERDGLTGLRNRRAFDEHLLRVWQQSLRDRPRGRRPPSDPPTCRPARCPAPTAQPRTPGCARPP